MKHVDEGKIKKWQTIYPAYINKKLKNSEGRRVPKTIAIPNPTIMEIAQVCQFLILEVAIEPTKSYPKDQMTRGRVRILFKDEGGEMMHETILTKGQLLKKICELIPKLKSRTANTEGYDPDAEEEKD